MKVAIMATGVTEAAADAALTTAFSLGSSDVDVVLSTEDESIAAANGMLMSMMLVGQTLVAAVADVVMYELDAYWYHDSSASINKAVANQLKLGIDTPTTLKNWNWLNARLVEAITDFDELSCPFSQKCCGLSGMSAAAMTPYDGGGQCMLERDLSH